MTRPAIHLVAATFAVCAGCSSNSGISAGGSDLSANPPDLTVTVDAAVAPDLAQPLPDLQTSPDLASVLALGGKIFFSGDTFDSVAPPAAAVMLPSVGKGNFPNAPPADPALSLSITVGPLYAGYVPNGPAFGATLFKLSCDAHTDLGQATQLELVYDFNGDKSSVRTEIYNLFPTDPINGWEVYTEANGLWSQKGGFASFVGGTLTARLWKTFQPGAMSQSYYQQGPSYLILPYQ